MPYYIKTRPNVKEVLGIDGFRAGTSDGNVLLWQEDARTAGFAVLEDAAVAMGGLLLTPAQALAECKGVQSAELPAPNDERFKTEEPSGEPAGESAGAVAEADEEIQAETQSQAESESKAEAGEETQEQAGEGETE